MWRTEPARGLAVAVVALAVVALAVLSTSPCLAVERIVIGGGTENTWESGGGADCSRVERPCGLDPVVVTGPQSISSDNTPGGVIDFAAERPGWIFPESADPEQNIALQIRPAAAR